MSADPKRQCLYVDRPDLRCVSCVPGGVERPCAPVCTGAADCSACVHIGGCLASGPEPSDRVYVTAYGQRIQHMLGRASKSPSLIEDFRSEVVAALAGFGAEMPEMARDLLCKAVESYDDAKGRHT